MRTENIIIHPGKGKSDQDIPESGLMLVTPSEAVFGQKLLLGSGGENRFLYNSRLVVSGDHATFVAGPAVGAPMAAMTMEKLIALGAGKIIMFGWCGAVDPRLQIGDVLIGSAPVSGEGTSRYYETIMPPQPSKCLVSTIEATLSRAGIAFAYGNIWSTDAPYREDRLHLKQLCADDEVCGVDMEYSALCSVSVFRKIEFAGVFLVSDELYREQWKPGFTSKQFRDKSMEIVRLLSNQ